jgi:nucleoside phosphorylase
MAPEMPNSAPMIVVMFALPQESSNFRRALHETQPKLTGGVLIGRAGPEEVAVAHSGVGTAAAGKVVRAVLAEHRPSLVISSGFAGGLDPRLKLGDLVVATNYSSAGLVEEARSFLPAGSVCGVLTTSPTALESPEEKQRIAANTGASAVDMETEAIAAACMAAAVPLLAVRAISDAATDPLPVPLERCYDLARQRPRPLGLLAYLLRHPQHATPFLRFVANLTRPRAALARFLVEFITRRALTESGHS